MTFTLKKVATDKCDYPSQPRTKRDKEFCLGLGENMLAVGQRVALIGYVNPATGRCTVYDGGCRLEGAKLLGIPEVLVMDLGKEPTPAEVKMAQASIDVHRQHLPSMDRARLWESVMKERGITARQLAKELGVSDSLVGRYLLLLTLPPDVQEQINSGALPMSKGGVIAREETDPDRQRELAALAPAMARGELAPTVRKNRRNEQKTPAARLSRIRIAMPNQATLVITGTELGMAEVVELLAETLKEARKASEIYDVKTWQSMMAAKAKGAGNQA